MRRAERTVIALGVVCLIGGVVADYALVTGLVTIAVAASAAARR